MTLGSIATEVALFAWPFVVLVAVFCLFRTETGRALLGGLRQIKFGQLHLELGGANASQVKNTLEEIFRRNRREVNRAFSEESHIRRIAELRNAVARSVLKDVVGSDDLLCTVYVQDVLFDDALYCLLDYWPKGRAAGKAYSVRYGIIGRAWRLRVSQAKSVVPGDRETLMTDWGMTDQEAAGHIQARSFLAVLLTRSQNSDDAVGILFAEGPPDTFCEDQLETVASAPETHRLADALAEVVGAMRKRGPELRVFEH